MQDLESEKEKTQILLAIERTRLAAERTISAWMRTGLACVGAGYALIKFNILQTGQNIGFAKGLGALLLINGILIFIFALKNFKSSSKRFSNGFTPSSDRWILTSIFILVFVFLLLLVSTIELF